MTDDRSTLPVLLLTTHALLIGSVLAYTALSEAQPTPDANIGTGLGMLALAGLGLPWSWGDLAGRFGHLSSLGELALLATFAVTNLVLHGILWMVGPRLRR